MITDLKAKTGLSRSEIIRRSVRLLRNRIQETGSTNVLYELPPTERKPVSYSKGKKK